MQCEMLVDLPYPHRYLSPNARVCWPAKYAQVKRHRQQAYLTALEQVLHLGGRPRKPIGKVAYTIHFIPKTRRGRDEDNLISSCKAYLDGIADAMGINDKNFTIRGVTQDSSTSRFRPRVQIYLNWEEEDNE